MAQCLTPYQLDQDTNVTVPCGKCPECRARRASGWSFRLNQELKRATSACFLTLTYDTQHLPISHSGQPTLHKPDMQNFFKKLRKLHPPKTIKYYYVGEYGGTTKRPHYHAIIFNAKLEHMQPSWSYGQLNYGNVSLASIGYCLKYISEPNKLKFEDDRQPEYANMSKGLGASYMTDAMINWHKADLTERLYCNIEDGKKITMPRYYKDKIYTDEERENISAAYAATRELLNEPLTRAEIEAREQGIVAAFNRQKKSTKTKV